MQVALHLPAQVSVKLEHCADLVVLASVGPAACILMTSQCSTASNWNYRHACPRRGHAAYFMAWSSTQLLYILMTLREGIGRHLTLIACIIAIQTSALLGYHWAALKKSFCFHPKAEALLTGIHSSLEHRRPQERACGPQIVCSPQHLVSCALHTYSPAVAPAVLHMARQQASDKPGPMNLQYKAPLPELPRADAVLWPGLQMLPETELVYLQ